MNKKVLIVEDDREVRDSLTSLLEMEGYSAAVADHGRAALDYLRSEKELPCLILLDLMMPVMDGFTFRAEQKADAALGNIPVVVMSAAGNIHEKLPGLEAKAYLKKPMDFDDVVSAVEQYCTP
ncbi:MAG TPA: response regulator [Gammaproteobacteria bacterium]|nr:response regulator [Gammaproteobacteria bacterium]